jgi:hypothetical protein
MPRECVENEKIGKADSLAEPPNGQQFIIKAMGALLRNRQFVWPLPLPKPPFTVTEITAHGTLAEALSKQVLHHPRVESLRVIAIAAAYEAGVEFIETGGLLEIVEGYADPMLPMAFFAEESVGLQILPAGTFAPDTGWCDLLEGLAPPMVEAYYDEVAIRATALVEMLQGREIDSWGHIPDGNLARIAYSIWSHQGFYVHPSTGDIYESTPGGLIKRWTGVVLEPPSAVRPSQMFHEKPIQSHQAPSITTLDTRNREKPRRQSAWKASIAEAVAALWLNRIPATLQLKVRDQAIREWQREKKLPVASVRTIRRHLTPDGQIRP